MADCSEIHTKPIKTPCGQNLEFLDVKPVGTYTVYLCVFYTALRCLKAARSRPLVLLLIAVLR